METFKDLEFKSHPATIDRKMKKELIAEGVNKDSDMFGEMKQARVTFDNGLHISVLFGKIFYSNGIDTYEAWCSNIDNEPKGHLTEQEVTEYMKEVQTLKDKQ